MPISIELARPDDLPTILALLTRSDLPQDGLSDHAQDVNGEER